MKKNQIIISYLMLCVNLAWSNPGTAIEIGHFDFRGGPLVDKAAGMAPLPDGVVGAVFIGANPDGEMSLLREFYLNGSELFGEAGYFLSRKLELNIPDETMWITIRIWNDSNQEDASFYWESPLTQLERDSRQISFSTDEWTSFPVEKSGEFHSMENAVQGYSLYPNYPNPFNAQTTLRFDIAEQTQVTMKLYSMLGREVEVITDNFYTAGSHTLNFDAAGLSSGNYLVQMNTATGFSQVRRMTLLK